MRTSFCGLPPTPPPFTVCACSLFEVLLCAPPRSASADRAEDAGRVAWCTGISRVESRNPTTPKKHGKYPPCAPLSCGKPPGVFGAFRSALVATSMLILVHQPREVFKMYHPSSFLWLLATSPSCAARSSRKRTQPATHSCDERTKRGGPYARRFRVIVPHCSIVYRMVCCSQGTRQPINPAGCFFDCDRLCVYFRTTTHMNRKTTSARRA